jgi:hypothetical protein
MNTTTAVVCVLAIVAALLAFALYRRPHLKAGGRYKDGEFYIEAKGRTRGK